MADRKAHQPYTEHPSGAAFTEAPPVELLHAHEIAGELEQLLRQEAGILKRFENQQLLEILHRKESLIRHMAEKLSDLEEAKSRHPHLKQSPGYDSLKACLKEIERLNRYNQAFIEGTLSHLNSFMDCLCPSSYAPGHRKEMRPELAAFKGMTFRKEI